MGLSGIKRLCKGGIFLLVLLALLQAGCAPRKVLQPEAQRSQSEIIQKGETPKKTEEIRPHEEKITPPAPEVITERPLTERSDLLPLLAKEERALEEEMKKIDFPDIYFDFDKYDIREDARPTLERLASWLKENPQKRVLIEGHCDERGTNQYNLALGERRALAAKNYLMALGIASSRIDTVTYGEERPLCRDHTEECWQLNRRAHFVIHE